MTNVAPICHSDRGEQYSCDDFRKELAKHDATPSMSGTGNCCDTAVLETVYSTLEREHAHRERYRTREQARADLFEYIEVFYNRKKNTMDKLAT